MKEIFVVDSYAKSPQQVDILASMIQHLTNAHRDICLVSHLPIPERLLTPRVRFNIFDCNNIIGRGSMVVIISHDDYEIQYRPAEIYHGAAVYCNMYNSLMLLAGRYDWAHFVECDLHVNDVETHLAEGFAPVASDPEIKVVGYVGSQDDPARPPAQMSTNLLSLRPEIAALLPVVATWNDYQRLGGGQSMIFEGWLLYQFRARNIRCALLKKMQMANRSHLDGDYTIIKCSRYDPLFTVIVSNRSARELECKTRSGMTFRMPPQSIARAENVHESDEFSINYVGSPEVFCHPVKTMAIGALRKKGVNCGPGWIEDAAANLIPG